MQNNSLSVQNTRLWLIKDMKLVEVNKAKLDFESRLEDWIASDMSIISPNLLFIGRQVPTLYGGLIDILAMEENGDLVIVELKRAR